MENVEAVQAEQKQILHKAMKTLQGGIDTNDYETTHSSRLLLTLPTLKTISLSTLMRELNNASWKRCSGAWFFRDVSLMKSNHDGILNLYTSLQVRAGIVFQERLRKQTLQESLIKAFTDGISENSETRNDVLDTKKSYDRLQLLDRSFTCIFSNGTWTTFQTIWEPKNTPEDWEVWKHLYLFEFFRGESANSVRLLQVRNKVVRHLAQEQYGNMSDNRVYVDSDAYRESEQHYYNVMNLLVELSRAMQPLCPEIAQTVNYRLHVMQTLLANELQEQHIVWSNVL